MPDLNDEGRPPAKEAAHNVTAAGDIYDRTASVRWIGVENHVGCTPACRDVAVPSPYDRERPPMVRCPWCGADPGEACLVGSSRRSRRARPLRRFGRFHPSRLEVAA